MIRSKQTASQANIIYASAHKYAHLRVSSANYTKNLVEAFGFESMFKRRLPSET